MRGKARFLILSLISALLALPAGAQLQPAEAPTPSELRVRVTYPNDQAVGMAIRVELINATGLSIKQSFTDEVGQVTFSRLLPGYYSLKVSGINVEDTTTPNFFIARGESAHYEYVRVQARGAAGMVSLGSGPAVSAAELNAPDSARREYDAGMEALNLKNWAGAKVHFQKTLEIYPQFARASVGLGVVFMNTGEPALGRQAFEAAYRLDEHLPEATRNLGIIAYKEKRYPEAESLLNKSLAGDPMNPESLLYLANTELLLDKPEEALRAAHRLHNLDHAQYTLVHVIAARALVALKRPEEAAAEYQLYLQESPTGPAAASVRTALQALQGQVNR